MNENPTMIFFNQAMQAHQVNVLQSGMTSAEHAIAEKLHGILSIMIFDQVTRMERANKA